MKLIAVVIATASTLLITACVSNPSDRTGKAPVVGATTGVQSQSTHSGNSDGSRTDLR